MFDKSQIDELCKVSHRPYTTGFYYGKPGTDAQVYTDSSYYREYDLIGIVTGYDKKTGVAEITQRNRFFAGDEIEIMQPGQPFFAQIVTDMENDKGEKIEVANHAEMTVRFKTDKPVCVGAMVRKCRGDNN